MTYIKILGSLAIAAASLMAFVGSASATRVTASTGGAAETPIIHMVNEGTHIVVNNVITPVRCKVTLEGSVVSHGSGGTATVSVSTLTFTGCTDSWHVTTIDPGHLRIEYTSGHNGTVTWDALHVNMTRFGVNCNYETNNTDVGTITGGNPATLDVAGSFLLGVGSSALCGSGSSKVEGGVITTSALYIAS